MIVVPIANIGDPNVAFSFQYAIDNRRWTGCFDLKPQLWKRQK
jgi:hypothetical protein